MTMRKATPQEEKDFREVVTVIIVAITLILLLVYVYPSVYTYVFGQVEVKQSSTINGQKSVIQQCDGTPKACVSNMFMNLTGTPGTIKVTESSGAVSIHYCVSHDTGERCKTYKLGYNGTITEVKK
jgi:hypothetical protein